MKCSLNVSLRRAWRMPLVVRLLLPAASVALLCALLFAFALPSTAVLGQARAMGQEPSAPADPGSAAAVPLFFDDFDDGNANGWTTSGLGVWSVVDGAYVVDMPDDQVEIAGYAFAGDPAWTDYSLEVDVQATRWFDKIIRARQQDEDTFYAVNLRSAPYLDVWLHRSVDGVEEVVATVPFSNGHNIWYHMTLIVEGPHIRVLVDDQLLIDHTETGPDWPTHGRIGLQGWNNATVHHDNVLVRRSPVAMSAKTVTPAEVAPGEPVTYTIALVNTDPISPTLVTVTDTLPLSLTYTPESLSATSGSYGYAGGVISWTGTISATEGVTLTYSATISPLAPRGTTILNTAVISADEEEISRSAAVDLRLVNVFLPAVQGPRDQP